MSNMTAPPLSLESLLEGLVPLIHEAGALVMRVYATDFHVEIKDDESPVTVADRCAEKVIVDGLNRLAPGIPVVGEEGVSAGDIPDVSNRFWLVDPVDGTKEFVSRNGEFTVNIALVRHGVPVLGLVLAPALGTLYVGAAGLGAVLRQPSAPQRHAGHRIIDRQSRLREELRKSTRLLAGVDPQEAAGMVSDMRSNDSDGLFVACCDDRADHVTAPEASTKRKGDDAPVSYKRQTFRDIQEACQHRHTIRTIGNQIQRRDFRKIGLIERPQPGAWRQRYDGWRDRFTVALVIELFRAEAE